MAQTLFYVPATLFGLPLFGVGLLFFAAVLIGGGLVLWQWSHGSPEASSTATLFAVLAGAALFLLPAMVEVDLNERPLGVPVRGFGVMLMLATIAGVGISAWRARQVGLDPEIIYSLAFWMFLGGILGARGFYVIQYWHEYFQPGLSLADSLKSIVNAAKGGLVVYGGLIGAVASAAWFLHQRKLPVLAIADIVAPGMAIGQSIGRIGCFLNGCCYGGLCTLPLVATPFPRYSGPRQIMPSPPYERQLTLGWLHGMELTGQQSSQGKEEITVSRVTPSSAAEQAGLKSGDIVRKLNGKQLDSLADARDQLRQLGLRTNSPNSGAALSLQTADGRTIEWTLGTLPAWSLPIHPTQLYAFLDAGLLALFLWAYYPFRRHDGEVFALLVTLHPISRFLLEMIRMDEPGQFGTALTISQWLSIALFIGTCGLWVYVERQPRRVQLAT